MFIFNWQELLLSGRANFDAILILTYASTLGYNKKIAWDVEALRRILKVLYVPAFLFQRKLLISEYSEGSIVSKFRFKDPQSYFLNNSFLFFSCSSIYKTKYLYLLSQRRINETAKFIPKHYVSEKFWRKNPLVRVSGEKIYFIPEITKSNREEHSS